tara:strand:+ start:99 stop:293 length:195 start_codon:yes stop_codon:yes gene_type:complete
MNKIEKIKIEKNSLDQINWAIFMLRSNHSVIDSDNPYRYTSILNKIEELLAQYKEEKMQNHLQK